jgi:hypothetical protein
MTLEVGVIFPTQYLLINSKLHYLNCPPQRRLKSSILMKSLQTDQLQTSITLAN